MTPRRAKLVLWSVAGAVIVALACSAIWGNAIISLLIVLPSIPVLVMLPRWLGLPPPDPAIYEQSPEAAQRIKRAKQLGRLSLYGTLLWAGVCAGIVYFFRPTNGYLVLGLFIITGGMLLSYGAFSTYAAILRAREISRRVREKKPAAAGAARED